MFAEFCARAFRRDEGRVVGSYAEPRKGKSWFCQKYTEGEWRWAVWSGIVDMRQEEGQSEWCDCSHCVLMDNPEERKCCKLRNCITSYKLFGSLCLDRNVLETAIKAKCDIRADELDFGINSYRKSAYRQYTLWRYGRFGKGNRRVCPACVVRMIRATYPSATGNYMGFRSS